MKKWSVVLAALLLAGVLFVGAGCDFNSFTLQNGGSPSGEAELPNGEQEEQKEEETGSPVLPEKTPEETPEAPPEEELPPVMPLAALDGIVLADALPAEDSGKMLVSSAEFGVDLNYLLNSEVTGADRAKLDLGAALILEDACGVRKNAESLLGFDLIGSGAIGLDLSVETLKDQWQKELRAELSHDGGKITVGDETTTPEEALGKLPKRIAETAEELAEDLGKEFGVRLAIERLIGLGFKAEVSTENGTSVRLTAQTGFFTDLLNDLLEELLPDVMLPYIPRFDLRFQSTEFDLLLAFDEAGKFTEFSLTSDFSVTMELRLRGLLASRLTLGERGSFRIGVS